MHPCTHAPIFKNSHLAFSARWELTKHRAEKPIVGMNEGHKKVSNEE